MSIRKQLGFGVFGLGFIVGCTGYAPDEDVGTSAQRIELHDLGASYGFAFTPSASLQPGETITALQDRLMRHSFPIQATGAILAPDLDAAGAPVMQFGSAVRFTCGATLISPSYLITAAHCVDSDSIKVATDTVVLEMYRPTSQLAIESTWRPKTQLTGTFPDFQHASYAAQDGYYVDHYNCTLAARCGSGSVNCPNTATAIDVALLHCDGRPGDRYGYLNVAASELPGVPVYTPWKHEVYDISASEPATSDKYLHYVKYPAAYGDNYHYLDRNQLLPLETIAWPDGTQPRKVSDVTQPTVWTDALGCHGTSGSGFLQQNPSSGAWELLGPTALAGSAFGGLLCEHLPGIAPQSTPLPGQANIGYSSVVQTQAVLSGSSTAWAADCASQPLGFFSLGGRTGCARAQSGLTFAPRSAYSDLDPWLSPTLQLGAVTTSVGAAELEAAKSYRVALGITPAAGCTSASSGTVCPEVVVRVGAQEVLRATLQASAGQTSLVGALFSAASGGSQVVTVSTPAGGFELGQLEIAPNVGLNSFDTAYERAEAALTVPSVDRKKALPMRFVGDGAQGLRALLDADERLLLVKEALALQGNFSVRFTSSFPGTLTCGLVDSQGSVLASAACSAGVSTAFSYIGAAPAAAVFVEGAPSAGVELDNLAISVDSVVISHCSNGVIDGGESDVDCGGTCSQHCAVGKACAAAADCTSSLCSAGKCVAAPSCTDGLKNGSETDIDCGGTCSQHCAVGKACAAATDCTSNLCTSGQCVAAPSCTDALKNGSETDVDCGGTCSQHCAVGKTCAAAADCTSNLCSSGKCVAAPSCTDGLKNGSETDIDCGGTCSQHCAVGKACTAAADCTSSLCSSGKCVAAPSCTDGLKNGSETDVDCGGTCSQHCAVGKACAAAADCTSNLCTAGKCAASSAAVVATLSLSSTWDVGYCAAVTVTNKSAVTLSSWTAVVNLAQSTVSSSWSSDVSVSGSQLTAHSLSWNGQLAPNASASFGYCANKTGSSWQPSIVRASSP